MKAVRNPFSKKYHLRNPLKTLTLRNNETLPPIIATAKICLLTWYKHALCPVYCTVLCTQLYCVLYCSVLCALLYCANIHSILYCCTSRFTTLTLYIDTHIHCNVLSCIRHILLFFCMFQSKFV